MILSWLFVIVNVRMFKVYKSISDCLENCKIMNSNALDLSFILIKVPNLHLLNFGQVLCIHENINKSVKNEKNNLLYNVNYSDSV